MAAREKGSSPNASQTSLYCVTWTKKNVRVQHYNTVGTFCEPDRTADNNNVCSNKRRNHAAKTDTDELL